MQQIEKMVHRVMLVLCASLAWALYSVLMYAGVETVGLTGLLLGALIAKVSSDYLKHYANRLLWLIRDFAKSEFERGRNTNQNWSNLE